MSPILGSRGISPRSYGFAGAGKPNAPVSVSATDVGTARAYNNGAATVSFSANGDNGAPISSFTVTSNPGGFTASGASSPLTVTGLQSGVSYTFTATATNAVGTSNASTASSAITATTIPQAVTIGTATCATGQAYTGSANVSVPFTVGGTGGKTVTYTATSSSSNTGSNSASPVTVSETVGNPTSTARTYTVIASNANGSAAASSASNSVAAISVPQAPTIGTATGGNASATVAYTANATGGAAVSTFTATSTPSSITGTGASPITVSGLSNGTAYTFKVKATNASGVSLESAASNSVTPVVPIVPAMYIAGGVWNTTTTGGSFTDYGKRNTGQFRFDTEVASTTSDNMIKFWMKPVGLSNPGGAAYVLGGGANTGPAISLSFGSAPANKLGAIEKLNITALTWSTIAATTSTTYTSYGECSSLENGTTAGFVFYDGNNNSSNTTTCTVQKLTYSGETISNMSSITITAGATVPFSNASTGSYSGNQSETPDISNPGVKGYLKGQAGPSYIGSFSVFSFNFSTGTHGAMVTSQTGLGGSFNHSFVNGSTAGYTISGNGANVTTFGKMPFSTETFSSTGTTLSTARGSFSARGYTAGGAAYLTAGNATSFLTNTDKLTFSTDSRSTIAQTCQGAARQTSLASVH
jgi:hypothetical protein